MAARRLKLRGFRITNSKIADSKVVGAVICAGKLRKVLPDLYREAVIDHSPGF